MGPIARMTSAATPWGLFEVKVALEKSHREVWVVGYDGPSEHLPQGVHVLAGFLVPHHHKIAVQTPFQRRAQVLGRREFRGVWPGAMYLAQVCVRQLTDGAGGRELHPGAPPFKASA